MKILIVWPTAEPEIKILFDALERDGHRVVYWIGEYAGEKNTPKGAIFHDHYDAWDAKPASALRQVPILPVSAELASTMHETESLILTMMNKHFDALSVDERKHIYYTMLGYWHHVIDTLKPDWVVYAQVPHSLYSNIIYDLSRTRGIQAICFEDTWVAHRLLSYRDFWKGSPVLRAAVRKFSGKAIAAPDLSKEMREYWDEQTQPRSRIAPAYMTFQKNTGEGWGLLRHRTRIALEALRRGRFVSLAFGYLRKLGRANLKTEYDRVVRAPDWSAPFVYFPLHFQPERTTCPQGGIYADQILALETLAAALPSGWEIYVKEHPSQWWLRSKESFSSARYRGYYNRLAKVPHVRLVPITTDTFDLTEKARTVAVVTGTAGWEGLLRGKRPLVFGIPWWRDCTGVYRVSSVEECARAMREIERGSRASREDVLRFLKALEESSVHAYMESLLAKDGPSPEENFLIITEHIRKEMGRGSVDSRPGTL